MKTILFVDDEAPLLDGLRTRLYKHRHKWTMRFLGDASLAIKACEEGPVDLIVSDIRMPGMDGGQLFGVLKERFPSIIRIVLSGYADAGQALRLTSLAHQYVAKPCNSNEIETIIERCFLLQDLLGTESLRRVVGRIGQLPAMPKVYALLQTALAAPEVTATEIAAIVNTDAAITSKVLQITNSAFFRLRKPIVRIKDAVTYLGFGTIRNLVMSAELFAQWKLPDVLSADVDLDHLQLHAQLAAQACKSLASGKVSPDDAWLAGLVHDIGYRILAQECPTELQNAIMLARSEKKPLLECEKRSIGATHAEIGAYLLGLWGLPYPIVEAVAMHHAASTVISNGFDLLATLAVSHALLDAPMAGELMEDVVATTGVDPVYFASLNAPFDLAEAKRRVQLSVSPEPIP